MTVIKRRIEPPTAYNYDNANTTYKQYIIDIEKLMLDAGLVKSSTADNIDVTAIPDFPVFDETSDGDFYIPGALSFDLNDVYQADFPVRMSIHFGIYKYNTNSSWWRQLIYVRVGAVNIATNEIETTKSAYAFTPMYLYNTASSSTISYRDYGLASFINVKPGLVCVCINPGFGESDTANTNIFFIIERNFDNNYAYNATGCNIIIGDNTLSTSSTSQLHTCAIHETNDTITTTATFIYVPSQNYLANGKLITLPVMHINDTTHVIQSPNMAITHDRAVSGGQEIDLVVGATTKRFHSIYSSQGTHPISTAAALLITGE